MFSEVEEELVKIEVGEGVSDLLDRSLHWSIEVRLMFVGFREELWNRGWNFGGTTRLCGEGISLPCGEGRQFGRGVGRTRHDY